MSDLCRRSYIGVCRGGVCVAAVISVSAKEVSVRVICVVAIILVSAKEVSVCVICVPEGCRESMSCQSVLQKCQVRASNNSVK